MLTDATHCSKQIVVFLGESGSLSLEYVGIDGAVGAPYKWIWARGRKRDEAGLEYSDWEYQVAFRLRQPETLPERGLSLIRKSALQC